MIPIRDDNPTRTTPYVVYLLLAANIAVFLLDFLSGQGNRGGLMSWAMIPAEITSGDDLLRAPNGMYLGPTVQPLWLSIFTSMFMHAGLLHIGGNMLYLWIFGNNIEDALGHVKFIIFYLAAGVAAAAAHIFSNPESYIPTVGASGAIAGVLGAYLILYPSARVVNLVFLGYFVTTIEIPAIFVLGFWFFIQFIGLGSAGMQQGGGVAYWAHIGGFVAGMLLILLLGGKRLTRRQRERSSYYREPWYDER